MLEIVPSVGLLLEANHPSAACRGITPDPRLEDTPAIAPYLALTKSTENVDESRLTLTPRRIAAPTTHHTETVIRAAIQAGVDYLDVQLSDAKLAALRACQHEFEKRNLCFVTEAGYHPGLPSVMVRYAAGKLDSIESAMTAGYLNIGNLPIRKPSMS